MERYQIMKKETSIGLNEIRSLLHENAEKGFIHPSHHEDMLRYYYLQQGDMRAVQESVDQMQAVRQGKLSEDPIRNMRYLFIINTALAARFVVEAGVPLETAYAISDLYIRKADLATSIDEIQNLNKDVYTTYVQIVQKIKKENTYTKPIVKCLNYIDSHFNEQITLEALSEVAKLTPAYLSALFKKEMGETFAHYIMRLRIETAKSLLSRTDYNYSQISESLAFCSQSHFTKVFKDWTSFTPKQYRLKFFDSNITMTQTFYKFQKK